jgi:hypothetical protein
MKSIHILGIGAISLISFGFMNVNPAETVEKEMNLVSNVEGDTTYNEYSFGYEFKKEVKRYNPSISFIVRGKYAKSITQEKLIGASQISDIIPNYPSKWIADYSTVNITVRSDENSLSAINSLDVLSKEQVVLLQNSKVNDGIYINVKYLLFNSITEKLENRDMHVYLTVIPEVEAVYPGGMDKVMSYLKDNCNEEMTKYLSKRVDDLLNSSSMDPVFKIIFSINETGHTVDIQMEESSGNTEIDNALLKLVSQMPKWNPAQNAEGNPVKQQFELLVGSRGC